MKIVEEKESVFYYNRYQVSEWREKCLLLEDAAREKIEEELKLKTTSTLTEIAKLPFPKFAVEYLKFMGRDLSGLNDPSIGYKLYMLDDEQMRILFEFLKNPSLLSSEVCKNLDLFIYESQLAKISDFLKTELEDILKLKSATHRNLTVQKKWIYISQYIDAKEAERMNLKGFQFYDQGQYKACNLSAKLNLLNEAGRTILSDYLGLDGKIAKPLKHLKELYGSYWTSVYEYVTYIFPYLDKSVEELINILGIEDESLTYNQTRRYRNKQMKALDIRLQIKYIELFKMSPEEREIVKSLREPYRKIYVAKKYMFDDDNVISEYFDILISKIKNTDINSLL